MLTCRFVNLRPESGLCITMKQIAALPIITGIPVTHKYNSRCITHWCIQTAKAILVLLIRGLHGPVFFGPARPVQLRPGPARCRRGKKRTVLKTTKKYRIKHTLVFFASHSLLSTYITCFLHAFWVLLIISCRARPGPSASEPGPARLN